MSGAAQLSLLTRYDSRTLEQRWRAWIAENEHVYRLFERFTLEAIAAGHHHYSADAIVHRIRWHTGVETRGDEFKINNSYVAMLSRKFTADHPEHAAFFRTRGQRA